MTASEMKKISRRIRRRRRLRLLLLALLLLIAALLQLVSKLLLGWLPGALGEIPFLQIGLPAILSLYFDLFSGCLQAFIFATLTMLYVAGGFPAEDYHARQEKRRQKREQKAKEATANL